MINASFGSPVDPEPLVLAPPAVSPRRSRRLDPREPLSELLPPFKRSDGGRFPAAPEARAFASGLGSAPGPEADPALASAVAETPTALHADSADIREGDEPLEAPQAGDLAPGGAAEVPVEEVLRFDGDAPVSEPAWVDAEPPAAEAGATAAESAPRQPGSDEPAADGRSEDAGPATHARGEAVARVEGASDVVEAGGQSASAPAPRMDSALSEVLSGEDQPVLEEVAGRLERIARALREGRPVELFSAGASDPLEVLIAGYALGYSEAYRRVSEERRAQHDSR